MLVSGAKYNAQCRWSIDDRYPLRVWRTPYDVDHGDRVFLRHEMIDFFLRNRPLAKVVLVVHNSDQTFTDSDFYRVQPFVIKVYAVNCESRLAVPIPLGFRDHQFTTHSLLYQVRAEPQPARTIPVLLNFLIATNAPVRQAVYDLFKDKPFCHSDPEYLHMEYGKSLTFSDTDVVRKRADFYRTLKRSRFAICPPGNGRDTHRVYECLFFGVIPIVKTSFLDPLYRQFPVWIVNDWSEVTEWAVAKSVPFAFEKYHALQGLFDPPPLPFAHAHVPLISGSY